MAEQRPGNRPVTHGQVRRGKTPGFIQCEACFGEYAPQQGTGTIYLHICPPVSEPEALKYAANGLTHMKAGDVRPGARDESQIVRDHQVHAWLAAVRAL